MIPPDLARVFRDAWNAGENGTAGDLRAYADALEACSDQRLAAFWRALQYVGVREDAGANADGEGHIDRWLEGAHVGDPGPWCASFVSEFLPPAEPRVAGALNLLRRYPKIPAEACHLMDLGGYATDTKGHGHVFYVIGYRPPQIDAGALSPALVLTLEGNADNACRVQLRRAATPGLSFARAPFAVALGSKVPGVVRAGVRLVGASAATR